MKPTPSKGALAVLIQDATPTKVWDAISIAEAILPLLTERDAEIAALNADRVGLRNMVGTYIREIERLHRVIDDVCAGLPQ